MATQKQLIKDLFELVQMNTESMATTMASIPDMVRGIVREDRLAEARVESARTKDADSTKPATAPDTAPELLVCTKIQPDAKNLAYYNATTASSGTPLWILKAKYRGTKSNQTKIANQNTKENIAISDNNKGKTSQEKRKLGSGSASLPNKSMPNTTRSLNKRQTIVGGIDIVKLADETNQRSDVVDSVLINLTETCISDEGIYPTEEVGTRRGYESVALLVISRLLNNPGLIAEIVEANDFK